ncbi:hypothetical protein VTK73DRAFT_29 [Phialemonium thermophilum]|uniref:Rgp1 n=1 Tax=Phialemonium thermophilum TaxID=223376 RepID=A0ABR3Y7Q4_9PEZI
MSSGDSASDIRVFIRWSDQTVFAGEEIQCTITFKNVARVNGSAASRHGLPSQTAGQAGLNQSSSPLPAQPPSSSTLLPPPANRGHRSSLSLSIPSTTSASRARSGSIPWSTPQTPQDPPHSRHNPSIRNPHKRSVSIVSIGSTITAEGAQNNASKPRIQRSGRGHARAASLQIVPRGNVGVGPRSAPHSHRNINLQNSPLSSAYAPNSDASASPVISTAPNTPGVETPGIQPDTAHDGLSDFKFPMSRTPESGYGGLEGGPLGNVASLPFDHPQNLPVRRKDQSSSVTAQPSATAARVLSTTSIAGTPRSSGEFYSLSNNSSETLASEYVSQQPSRNQGRNPHSRRISNQTPQTSAKMAEILMMGYAQVQGTFSLDGSLVDLAPFEQVKRKAVVGGHGGGVVGVETSRRESGLFRSLGWSSLTNSIGEFLGGNELSTIKEMRGVASSKSVPLLSTPQSILFVDLRLGPGESRSYDYSFRLPRGLPPTHRGKAIKISYSLVVGTQRPGGVKEQQIKSVEVPFRVLGSVNSHGEILGHDLMTPYMILQDQAQIREISHAHHKQTSAKRKDSGAPTTTVNSFLSYVDQLLARPQEGSRRALLSPSATPSLERPSSPSAFDDVVTTPPTAKEAIDMAILRSNLTEKGQQASNRFEIARNGRRLGVVMLTRPAYRLGETVNLVMDFSGAELPCYAVHAALETAERVDPSLALRSEASVHRVTRKVIANSSEVVLYARRFVFNPTIPVSATPEFVTSVVSLEWKVRLEFVVSAHADSSVVHRDENEAAELLEREAGAEGGSAPAGQGDLTRRSSTVSSHPLLEELSRDDKGGLVLVAAENLPCESFEVAVPLRVYGAVCTGIERLERDPASDEGLTV